MKIKNHIVCVVCLVATVMCHSLFSSAALAQADYGDLPDNYSTLGDNAPSHMFIGSEDEHLKLGESITAELDGQPEVDGRSDIDDGIVALTDITIAGSKAFFEVVVDGSVPSEGAFLGVWIDWEHNFQFDRHDFSAYSVVQGLNLIEVPVSIPYEPDALGARFRLFAGDQLPGGELDWTDFEGEAVNGEVEDYVLPALTSGCYIDLYYENDNGRFERCSIEVLTAPAEAARDFGDLPDHYSSVNGTYAPAHIGITIGEQLRLGSAFSTESNATPDDNAITDDSDDGITISPQAKDIAPDSQLAFTANVTGTMLGDDATIAFWIDWNHNGEFGENEFYAFPATHGENSFSVVAPSDYVMAALAVRVRLFDGRSRSAIPAGADDGTLANVADTYNIVDWTDFDGVAINGEIEDYVFTLTSAPTAVTLHTLSTTTLTPLLILSLFILNTLFLHKLIKR